MDQILSLTVHHKIYCKLNSHYPFKYTNINNNNNSRITSNEEIDNTNTSDKPLYNVNEGLIIKMMLRYIEIFILNNLLFLSIKCFFFQIFFIDSFSCQSGKT